MTNQHIITHIAKMLYTPKDPISYKKFRIGNKWDGGYVICDDLKEISSAISIGIGDEVSFDLNLADRGVKVHQFDHTVEGSPINHANFNFNKNKWCEDQEDEQSISLENIIKNNNINGDAILKFDVEGDEWKNLKKVDIETLKQCRLLIGEFHFLENLEDENFCFTVLDSLIKLTTNHTLIHTHANNFGHVMSANGVLLPFAIELTFLRNDRTDFREYHGPIPTAIDYPNYRGGPDIIIRP